MGQSAACLKPEATALVQQLLPPGTAVRLEFDPQGADAEGTIVAAVFSNDKLVNESIALAGLGVADSRDGAGRFLPQVEKAQESARAERVGAFLRRGGVRGCPERCALLVSRALHRERQPKSRLRPPVSRLQLPRLRPRGRQHR